MLTIIFKIILISITSSANSLLQKADALAQQKNHDQVIALLNPYTDQLATEGFLRLAHSYSQKQDYANEVRVLKLLVAKKENDFQWQMLLAQAYVKQASLKKISATETHDLITNAIQGYRKVLQLRPKYKLAFDSLLKILIEQPANNEARELLMEGITRYGRRPELFRELCRLDSHDGFLVQAISNCTDSIKMSPNFPDHYVYLIQALHDQREEVKSDKYTVVATTKFPNSEFVQWAAGTVHLRRKNYPVATRYFAAGLKADPNSVRSHFGLAQAQFESGQEQAALEHFIFACKNDPKTIDTFFAALGRLKQKNDSKLIAKYSQATNTCSP